MLRFFRKEKIARKINATALQGTQAHTHTNTDTVADKFMVIDIQTDRRT